MSDDLIDDAFMRVLDAAEAWRKEVAGSSGVERTAVNRVVAGSNPAPPANQRSIAFRPAKPTIHASPPRCTRYLREPGDDICCTTEPGAITCPECNYNVLGNGCR